MDIRNRTNDIVALRCHVCQDFLKLVLVPDWKQRLYKKAQNAVDSNFRKDNYIESYNKMRDIGLDAYGVDCMDVSFISVIILFCSEIAPTQKSTKDALRRLSEDRNTTNHSNENEPSDELYLRALLSVSDIIYFIRTVDNTELTIADEDRLRFRTKWVNEAENLKTLLDNERIECVQIHKDIAQDISIIKQSGDALGTWCDVYDKYSKHYMNTPRYNMFIVAASDEKIPYAHTRAASYFLQKREYDEFFRRLSLLCSPDIRLSKGDVLSVLDELNHFLWLGNKGTAQSTAIVDYLSRIGFDIFRNEGGYFRLRK